MNKTEKSQIKTDMNHEYDVVIVGAGPSGLALAQCISHLHKRIAIVEKETTIGGCHAVRRHGVAKLFTEHGPRVYSETYTVFQDLLKDMGVNFYDLFTPYQFSIGQIGGETIFSTLSFRELFILGMEFIKLLFKDDNGRHIALSDFLHQNQFSEASHEIIDRICKLTDGGGASKFTLNEFLEIGNQQFVYKLYQPTKPNDKGFLQIWKQYLENRGVDFYLGASIKQIGFDKTKNKMETITVRQHKTLTTTMSAAKFVFAVPPKTLVKIIDKHHLPHNWGDLHTFARKTAYIEYVSVTLHWNTKLQLKHVYGFPKSEWGIAFVVLSDYMDLSDEKESQTMISVAVTITNKRSRRNGKTADECNEQEIKDEVFAQMQSVFGQQLPRPTHIVVSPEVEHEDGHWVSEDTAFITTPDMGYLPFQNGVLRNMYNVGTHNGKHLYKFTSLESAVSNAVYLSKEMYSELRSSKYVSLSKSVSFSSLFRLIVSVLCVYFVCIFIYGLCRKR